MEANDDIKLTKHFQLNPHIANVQNAIMSKYWLQMIHIAANVITEIQTNKTDGELETTVTLAHTVHVLRVN